MKRIILYCIFAILFCSKNVICQQVWENCVTPGQLAMTFDDGPHSTMTQGVLDLFKSRNLSTTFFVVGTGNWESNVTRYRETILRAYNEGHQIGSHSWSHRNLQDNITDTEIRSELRSLAYYVGDILGKNLTVFRPPYGAYGDPLLRIATQEFNYAVVNWSIDTQDWSHEDDIDAGFKEYFDILEKANATVDSFIGLHHDWTSGVVELANRTIDYVQQKGYKIVTVAECLGIPKYM